LNSTLIGIVQHIGQPHANRAFRVVICVKALLTGHDDQESSSEVSGKIDRAANIVGGSVKGHPQRASKAPCESQATDTDSRVSKDIMQSMLTDSKYLLPTHCHIANAAAMQLLDFSKQ
jgi:hypothetical protein